jgi:hypothetical protein
MGINRKAVRQEGDFFLVMVCGVIETDPLRPLRSSDPMRVGSTRHKKLLVFLSSRLPVESRLRSGLPLLGCR